MISEIAKRGIPYDTFGNLGASEAAPDRGKICVLAISGSLRKSSFNTALLRAAQELAPEGFEIAILDLKDVPLDVPLYNGDVEAPGDPPQVALLKAAIRSADGLLIATPEYNHGPSGVLKNAIDWASRDRGHWSLTGKPTTMIGAGGFSGTARAQQQLETILTETGALVMVKPGVLVPLPSEKFDGDGRLVDQQTRAVLREHMDAFANWIARLIVVKETLGAKAA